MRISRSSIAWFAFYSALFSALLFAFQVANSPTPFASAPDEAAIETPDLHVELTSEGLSKRERVEERLASAPEKPPYEILLNTRSNRADYLKDLLEATVSSSFFESKITPISVEVTDSRAEPRGQTSTDGVSLIANIPTESEFLKVFVHELGHVVDLRYLAKWALGSDPSDEFYAISWLDYQHKKRGMTVDDFVSGYALTNMYEDFAESFAFYVFHNVEFKRRAAKNASLEAKYDFLSRKVFPAGEFQGTSFESDVLPTYVWDVTKVPVKTNKYLFYLR